jgi:hypothetical protein
VIFISGCAQASPTQEVSPIPPTKEQVMVVTEASEIVSTPEPYPVPEERPKATVDPAYPAPEVEAVSREPEVTFSIPTPGTDTGAVMGVLVNKETGDPLAFKTIYLGTIIYLTPGPAYTIGMKEKASPHTKSDAEGRFALEDVPPGSYVVLVWTPFDAAAVIDEKTEKELEVIVNAGETTDLGTIRSINLGR